VTALFYPCCPYHQISCKQYVQYYLMRLKHRYLIAQILSNEAKDFDDSSSITSKEIISAIRDSIQELYGDVGMGTFGVSAIIKYFDPNATRRVFIVRVNREFITQVWYAISITSAIKKYACTLRCLCVAGSLRTCSKKALSLMSEHFGADLNDNSNEEYSRIRTRILESLQSS
jgi:ribonuclease P/MRP protein subunit POP5